MKLSAEDQKIADQVVETLREYGISDVMSPNDLDDDDPPALFWNQALLTLAVCAAFDVPPSTLGASLVVQAATDPATQAIIEFAQQALQNQA